MRAERGGYTQGDWIVHASYGVGQVRQKDKKELDGKKEVFFKVKTFNGVYWLSESNCEAEHIRPVASDYQLRKALKLIEKKPKIFPKDHNKRKKEIVAAMKNVSLYTRARLIRDLHAKRRLSKLNFSEEDAFAKMKKVILDEWAVVKEVDREKIQEKLDQALEISAEKILDEGR